MWVSLQSDWAEGGVECSGSVIQGLAKGTGVGHLSLVALRYQQADGGGATGSARPARGCKGRDRAAAEGERGATLLAAVSEAGTWVHSLTLVLPRGSSGGKLREESAALVSICIQSLQRTGWCVMQARHYRLALAQHSRVTTVDSRGRDQDNQEHSRLERVSGLR